MSTTRTRLSDGQIRDLELRFAAWAGEGTSTIYGAVAALAAEARTVRGVLAECLWAYDNDSVKLEADDEMWEQARSALAVGEPIPATGDAPCAP